MARPRETHTGNMTIGQKPDIDISMDSPIIHGEALPNIVDSAGKLNADSVAFMEEPVTIRIEENSRSDFPESHAPVQVNGRGAEVQMADGKWVEMTWVPIGQPITTKRKFVEVLARAKADAIRTIHDDGSVERPRNTLSRRSSSSYPMSIIMDRNPVGHEWLSNILMGY